MTEHTTDQIDTEAEAIIDLTMDQTPEQIDAEAKTTIDLTTPPGEGSAAEIDESAVSTDENEELDSPQQVEQPAAEEGTPAGPPAVDVPLRRVLEAVLLIAEDPLPTVEIAARLEVPAPEVEAAIHELAAEYEQQERGFALREIAGGWRFYTAAECAPEVERFLLAGQTSRLSQAALETLAVVAYQQPVSRSRIAAVRGVSVDGVMKTLVSRGLVAESGTDSESGAIMYVTTPKFLERLGLRDLSELPPLAPLLPGLDELPEE